MHAQCCNEFWDVGFHRELFGAVWVLSFSSVEDFLNAVMELVRSKHFGGVMFIGQSNCLANGCDSATNRASSDLAFVAVVSSSNLACKSCDCVDSAVKGSVLKVRVQS
jgi:hypothetical protein